MSDGVAGAGAGPHPGQSFEGALRGYDKRQVDEYVAQVRAEVARLTAARDQAQGEAGQLGDQLRAAQSELADLRSRPVQIDRASLRDVSPMVEQMLTMAEKQAATVVSAATQRAANREAEAQRLLDDAQNRTTTMVREFEMQLSARRAADYRGYENRRAAAEAELVGLREAAEKALAEANEAKEAAQREAQAAGAQQSQQVERAKAEAEALLEAARAEAGALVEEAGIKADKDLSLRRAELDKEINDRRADAAHKIAALHAQAQQQVGEVQAQVAEQTAAHQQQIAILVQEIEAQRQTLATLQGEIETVDRKLGEYAQNQAAMEQERVRLQERIDEAGQALAAEQQRFEETRRAADVAEQHARDVRARIHSEARRVADLAAAAVIGAAADVLDSSSARPDGRTDPPAVAEPPGAVASAHAPAPGPDGPGPDGAGGRDLAGPGGRGLAGAGGVGPQGAEREGWMPTQRAPQPNGQMVPADPGSGEAPRG